MKARVEAAADEAHAQTLLPERLMPLTHVDKSNPRRPVGIVSFRPQAAKAVCKNNKINAAVRLTNDAIPTAPLSRV
jgi:hypothetical protein